MQEAINREGTEQVKGGQDSDGEKEPRYSAHGTEDHVGVSKQKLVAECCDKGKYHCRQADNQVNDGNVEEEHVCWLPEKLVSDHVRDDDEQIPDQTHDEEQQHQTTCDPSSNLFILRDPPERPICDICGAQIAVTARKGFILHH